MLMRQNVNNDVIMKSAYMMMFVVRLCRNHTAVWNDLLQFHISIFVSNSAQYQPANTINTPTPPPPLCIFPKETIHNRVALPENPFTIDSHRGLSTWFYSVYAMWIFLSGEFWVLKNKVMKNEYTLPLCFTRTCFTRVCLFVCCCLINWLVTIYVSWSISQSLPLVILY